MSFLPFLNLLDYTVKIASNSSSSIIREILVNKSITSIFLLFFKIIMIFSDNVNNTDTHVLIYTNKRNDSGKLLRRRCAGCYQKLRAVVNWKEAYKACKQVTTKCNICDKFYCTNCFIESHKALHG